MRRGEEHGILAESIKKNELSHIGAVDAAKNDRWIGIVYAQGDTSWLHCIDSGTIISHHKTKQTYEATPFPKLLLEYV